MEQIILDALNHRDSDYCNDNEELAEFIAQRLKEAIAEQLKKQLDYL
jgi:hypothetical protein|tara:strand:- start:1478 stop:1618 length:141 start_codon:yes stop_codon:yes gene_type:complete